MVVSLVYCGEGWLWFVVSLYFMCACVSFVELDLFVLIDRSGSLPTTSESSPWFCGQRVSIVVCPCRTSVQFFISCVISVLIWAEFSSILLTSSLLVLIAAKSRRVPPLSLLSTTRDFQEGTHLTCIVVCVPMQMFFHSRNAVKIAISSSLFFATLMGERIHSSCFCIQLRNRL